MTANENEWGNVKEVIDFEADIENNYRVYLRRL